MFRHLLCEPLSCIPPRENLEGRKNLGVSLEELKEVDVKKQLLSLLPLKFV